MESGQATDDHGRPLAATDDYLRKTRGNTKDWLEAEKRLNLALAKAFSTQRPVGVPAKEPRTETPRGRPVDPLITTRT